MNETEQYIVDCIKTWVRSGFYDQDDIDEMIEDILEDDVDVEKVRSFIPLEMEKKRKEESTWPETTQCDLLDRAFDQLNADGIIALHNAGYTMSDGHEDVAEELHERPRDSVKGYCFYHGQDLERVVAGEGLNLAFGDLRATDEGKIEIGRAVKAALETQGFSVVWNDDPNKRIHIADFVWQRRGG